MVSTTETRLFHPRQPKSGIGVRRHPHRICTCSPGELQDRHKNSIFRSRDPTLRDGLFRQSQLPCSPDVVFRFVDAEVARRGYSLRPGWLGTYRDVKYPLFCSCIRQDLGICLEQLWVVVRGKTDRWCSSVMYWVRQCFWRPT